MTQQNPYQAPSCSAGWQASPPPSASAVPVKNLGQTLWPALKWGALVAVVSVLLALAILFGIGAIFGSGSPGAVGTTHGLEGGLIAAVFGGFFVVHAVGFVGFVVGTIVALVVRRRKDRLARN